MHIVIKTIPHEKHRYETCGDYFWDSDGTIQIRVSAMGNEDYEFLVALHELVEAHLCKKRGITDEVITRFDEGFEAVRPADDVSEPGDDPSAPYQNEHCFATAVERMACAALGVKWAEYEKAVLGLGAPCAS